MADIRPAAPADVDAMIAVKDAATEGWAVPRPASPEELRRQRLLYEHLLRTGAAAVAIDRGELVGFGNAIVREDRWFLSQLFVRPDVQGGGAGAAVLDHLLARREARSARVRAVLSSDDPRALGLYLSRGMLPAGWSMVHMVRRVEPRAGPRPGTLSRLLPEDQPGVDALDRQVRGWARTIDHALFRELGSGHAVRDGGELGAYLYVQPGGRVAPLVARDDVTLLEAADAADGLAGPEAQWDVPSSASALVARLLDLGYRPSWLSTFCADGPVGPFDRLALAGGAFL